MISKDRDTACQIEAGDLAVDPWQPFLLRFFFLVVVGLTGFEPAAP